LLIEHRLEQPGLLAVENAILRRRIAHAFHQHADEHCLELLRRAGERLVRVLLGKRIELRQRVGVDCELRCRVGRAVYSHAVR
jgi:hypothetical protein